MNKRLLFALSIFASLFGKAQIIPADLNFEGTWTNATFGSTVSPNGWVTTNVLTSPLVSTLNPITVTQVTAACSGTAAMRIETKKFATVGILSSNIPDTSGFAFTGILNVGAAVNIIDGFAYTARPNKMVYCVETQPTLGDTSGIQLVLWKSVGGVRNFIGFAGERYFSPITSSTSKTVTVVYTSTLTPDSASIYIGSSFKFPSSGLFIRKGAKIGSTIIIDNIIIGTNIGLNESYINAIELSVFPNPSNKGVVEFKTESEVAKKFVIQDIAGRPITEGYFENGKAILNTNVYQTGIYMYSILNASNQNVRTGKLIIN
jgi:hypothetical protein